MHMWNSFSWTEFESIFINPKKTYLYSIKHKYTSLYLKTSKHFIVKVVADSINIMVDLFVRNPLMQDILTEVAKQT